MHGRNTQWCGAVALWLVALTAIGGLTNTVPATNEVAAQWAHIQEKLDRLAALEQQARASQQVAQADCLRDRLVKLQGVLAVGQQAEKTLRDLDAENDAALREQEALKIQFAALRAEKLWADAQSCLELQATPPSTTPKKVAARPTGKIPVRPRPAPPSGRPTAVRNSTTCVTQARLACLVATAMELASGVAGSTSSCATALSQRAIEPLDGWRLEQCATVDDLYVVAARAVGLRVAEPADPRSYGMALRDAGLAVDTVLPECVPGAPAPFLVEEEARRFLEVGYAAPLSSSRPLRVD